MVATAWFAILAFVLPQAATAQTSTGATGTVTGRVSNAATGEYLKYARVEQVGGNNSTVTGPGGEFTLVNLPAGEVQLLVNYTGLDPAGETVMVGSGSVTTKDFSLRSAVYDDKSTFKLETLVVAAAREGQAAAIMNQRASPNSKSVISTDVYGNITDGNLAEFLRYMPGLTIDYNESDPSFVRVRGFDPQYTSIQIDGNPVANTSSNNLTGGAAAGGRTILFEALSINNVETIEITKVPLANADASSGAGVINMKSRRAFDRQGRLITGSASLVANSLFPITLGKTGQPKNTETMPLRPNYTLDFSDVFLDGRLGVVAGVQYHKTINMMSRLQANWAFDNNATNNETEVPRLGAEFKDGAKEVTRRNASLNVDFKLSKDAFIGFRSNYSDFDTWIYDRLVGWDLAAQAAGATITDQTTATNNNNLTRLRGGYFHKVTDTTNLSVPFEFKKGRFAFESALAWSKSNTYYSKPSDWSVPFSDGSATPPDLVLRNITYRVQMPDPSRPYIQFTQLTGPGGTPLNPTTSVLNLANYPNPYTGNVSGNRPVAYGNYFTEGPQYGHDTLTSGVANLRINFSDWKLPTVITTGASVRKKSLSIEKPQKRFTYIGPVGALSALAETKFPLLITDWTNYQPQFMDRAALATYIQQHPDQFVETEDGKAEAVQNLFSNSKRFKEEIDGYYLMASVKALQKLTFYPGFRYERSEAWGGGYADIGDRKARALLGLPSLPTGQTTPTNVVTSPFYTVAYRTARYGSKPIDGTGTNYDTFLNFQVKYEVTKDLIVQAAYRESVQRPAIGNLLPTISGVNPDALPQPTVSVSNPELKSEYGKTFDVTATYYFEPSGMFKVSYFRQDFRNKVATRQEPVPEDGIFGDTTSFAGYLMNTPYNIDGPVHMSGFEMEYAQSFSFLPGLLQGLGARASFTYLRPDDKINFFNAKPKTASGSITYRYRRFAGNVNATWAAEYWSGRNTGQGTLDYTGKKFQVDIGATYQLTKNATLYLSGKNVNNAPNKGYRDSYANQHLLTSYTVFGATWEAGARLRF